MQDEGTIQIKVPTQVSEVMVHRVPLIVAPSEHEEGQILVHNT